MKNKKTIHKFVALLLSISMIPALSPIKGAEAASKNLFCENFESFEAGVIKEATEHVTGNFGNIHYELYTGDKIEIVEDNGNKYLKFTRRSTSGNNSYVVYEFPSAYDNQNLTVSYDFRPEVHSQYFSRFGTLVSSENGIGKNWASGKPAIQQLISYAKNVYVDKATNSSYWIGGLCFKDNYKPGTFSTVTQKVNLGSASNNYTFSAKYTAADGSTKNLGPKTRNVTASDVKGIAWAVYYNTINGWNGPDSGDAVYLFDNLVVSTEGMDVLGASIESEDTISPDLPVEITFDAALENNYKDHITVEKDGSVLLADEYDVGISNDKKTVSISGFEYNSNYKITVDNQLKSFDGIALVGAYSLNFKTISIISHEITKTKYEKGFAPKVNSLDGISYTYFLSKDDAGYEEYDLSAINEDGEYILKIVATDVNGKEQIEVIYFEIVGPIAPEAKGVRIECDETLDVGVELVGKYTYFDGNDDLDENMDYCEFQWYRFDENLGKYVAIGGATDEKYILTDADEDKYIKFGVKPYSKVSPEEGEEELSDEFASFMNPEVTDISIVGDMVVNKSLTVDYNYFDLNGDEEILEGTGATIVIWYALDSEKGEYIEIGRGRSYTLKAEDVNKWIKVSVIPKNNGGGKQEKAFDSYSSKVLGVGGNDLLMEDFEDYEVGVIIAATEYTKSSIGNIHYELYAGDKIEIAEDNGNKYLKFTRVAEDASNSYVMYEFPTAYDNEILTVTYDFRPEVHSQNFSRFGTLVSSENGIGTNWGSNKPVIQQIISYGKNFYVDSKTSDTAYWIGGLGFKDNYQVGAYATVTQKINLKSTSDNYTFSATYPAVGGGTTNLGPKIRTVTASDVNGIVWAVNNNSGSGWNGPDSGDAVYLLDNILVSSEGMSIVGINMTDENVIEVAFDDKVSGSVDEYITICNAGTQMTSDKYTVSTSADKKKVLIGGLDYNTEYTLNISKNLESENGKKMIKDFETDVKTASVIKHDIEREMYGQGYIPKVTELSGVDYSYFISKDDGEFLEYNFEKLDEIGTYNLKIVATGGTGKTQTEIIKFEIAGPVAPEVTDVLIEETKTLGIDTVLTGKYTYLDINDVILDENKDYCIFQWYRSKEKDGKYVAIEGANGETYKLTSDDEDMYIKFGVKPISKVEPKEGKEVLSDAFLSFMNPEVTNISILGKFATNEELMVNYHYSDLNGDKEIIEGDGATIVIWSTSSTKDGSFAEVGRGRNYKLEEKDDNKWIKVSVIPKNNGDGKQENVYNSSAVEGAFAPMVNEVKIVGNVNVGSTISVDYKFDDKNRDAESESIIEWYIGGQLVKTAANYTISEDDAGKSIYVKITPKSSVAPTTGAPVMSESVYVSEEASTVKPSGGGGGGMSLPITKPEEKPDDSNNKQEGFVDVSGHWAESAILKMVEQGIIKGKTATNFAPNDKITRAEFAALISRIFKLEGEGQAFSDVSKDSWYYGCISAVSAAGYMSGAYGTFRPTDNITREEMAVVIYAIVSEKDLENEGEGIEFNDADTISDWAKTAVGAIAQLGIINGMGENTFAPKGDTTRAQAVIVLARLQEKLGQ